MKNMVPDSFKPIIDSNPHSRIMFLSKRVFQKVFSEKDDEGSFESLQIGDVDIFDPAMATDAYGTTHAESTTPQIVKS